MLLEQFAEPLRLGHSSRKSVEHEPVRTVRSIDAARKTCAPVLSPAYLSRPPEGREKLLHGPAFRAEARPASLGRLPLPPAAKPALPCKSLIVAHDQLRFKLLDGVHRDTDNDQQRCAAKIKVNAKPIQNELRKVTVKPVAAKPGGQVV